MSLPVKLEVFEGPLDLLLHLIEKNKIDIYDIPIAVITRQYFEYIKDIQAQNMNIMSEFLVMAATLLDIKCRMLLPKEVNEDGVEEDPRAELVQRLIEYKMYKYMAFELRDRQVDAAKMWYKKPMLPQEVRDYKAPIDYETLIGDVNIAKLNEIFKSVMRRQEDKIDPIRSRFGKIDKDEINLEAKQAYIEEFVKSHKRFSFRRLLEKQGSKMEIVVTFIALLEMMKQGIISIEQETVFADIIITSSLAA